MAADGDLDGERAAAGDRGERLPDERRLAVPAGRNEEDLLAGGQVADQPIHLGLAVDERIVRHDLAVDERVLHWITLIDVAVTSINVTELPAGVQRELARVDRHADDGVDAFGVERSISSTVVMPPAAVTRRAVARLTARMAFMSVPCISPSVSTWV